MEPALTYHILCLWIMECVFFKNGGKISPPSYCLRNRDSQLVVELFYFLFYRPTRV